MDILSISSKELSARGKAAYEGGLYEAAAGLFEQAENAFTSENLPLDAAEMANNRSVALLQAGNAAAALEAAQGTQDVFLAHGDTRRQAMSIGNQAAALEALERPEEALAFYFNANELLKPDVDNELRALILKSISALQMKMGRRIEAMASMQAALSIQKHLSLRERVMKSLLRVPINMLGGK